MQFHLVELSRLSRCQEWSPQNRQPGPRGTALLCLGADSCVRKASHRIASHPVTNAVGWFFIVLSTLVTLASEPRYSLPRSVDVALLSIQCVCMAFFWVRMLLEIVVKGLLLHKGAFLRSFWGVAEVVMNVFGILQLTPPTSGVRWMRAFAALRPVRFVLWIPGLSRLVTSLARSFPYLFDLTAMLAILVFCFAMIGLFSVESGMAQRCVLAQMPSIAGQQQLHRDAPGRRTFDGVGGGEESRVGARDDSEPAWGISFPFVLRNLSAVKCGTGRRCPIVYRDGAGAGVPSSCQAITPALHEGSVGRDTYYHFKNIGAALLVVLQVSMVDNWYQPLEDLMSVRGAGSALYAVAIVCTAFCVSAGVHAVVRDGYSRMTADYAAAARRQRPSDEESDQQYSNILTRLRRLPGSSAGGQWDTGQSSKNRCGLRSRKRGGARMHDGWQRENDDGEDGRAAGKTERLLPRTATHGVATQTAAIPSQSISIATNTHCLPLQRGGTSANTLSFTAGDVGPLSLSSRSATETAACTVPLSANDPKQAAPLLGDSCDGGMGWVRPAHGNTDSCSLGFIASIDRQGLFHALSRLETTTRVGCATLWQMGKTRVRIAKSISSMGASLLLELLSLANMVLLAVVFSGMRASVAGHLMQTTAVIAIFFLVPLVFKVTAFGPTATASDLWNYIDVLGAASGVVELATPRTLVKYAGVCGILCSLRTLHVLKYVTPSLSLWHVWRALFSWLLLASMTVVLFSLLGMQLFDVSYSHRSPPLPQPDLCGDFSTLWFALLAVFSALTGANVSLRIAHVFAGGTIPTGVLFFYSLSFVSMCVLQPLLLAILIDGFQAALRAESNALCAQVPPPLVLPTLSLPIDVLAAAGQESGPTPRTVPPAAAVWSADAMEMLLPTSVPAELGPVSLVGDSAETYSGNLSSTWGPHGSDEILPPFPVPASLWWRFFQALFVSARFGPVTVRNTLMGRSLSVSGVSLFYQLPRGHTVRRVLVTILGSSIYRILSMLCVLAGFVGLFFERRTLAPHVDAALRRLNIFYVTVVWLDMVARWVAYGLVHLPGDARPDLIQRAQPGQRMGSPEMDPITVPPYFVAPLNWVECAGNGLAFAGLFFPPLRVGRVLHLTRLAMCTEWPNEGARLVLGAAATSAKVIPFVATLHAIFAIMGVFFFAGRMHTCTDANVTDQRFCSLPFLTTRETYFGVVETIASREWRKSAFHYDNFGNALLSVLVVSTTTNWTTLMAEAMSVPPLPSSATASATFRGGAVGEAGLSYFHSGYYVVYFIAILLLVRMLAMKTITACMAAHLGQGLIIARHPRTDGGVAFTFADTTQGPDDVCSPGELVGVERSSAGGCALRRARTTQALEYVANHDSIGYVSGVYDGSRQLPTRPLGNLLQRCTTYRVNHIGKPLLDYAVCAFALMHTGFMAARHYGIVGWEVTMFDVLDYVAIGVYALEAIVRLAAHGVVHYVHRGSRLLDVMVLVFLSIAVAVPKLAFFRAFAVLKLVRASGIDMTLRQFSWTAHYALNALGIYAFVLMAYAVVGTILFGDIDVTSSEAARSASSHGLPYPLGLSEKRNFGTVIGALLVLFDCSTGDNWHAVMLACGSSGGRSGAPPTHVAVIYFATFVILVNMLLLPLLLAVVVETFVQPTSSRVLGHFHSLRVCWSRRFGHSLRAAPGDAFLRLIPELPQALTGIHGYGDVRSGSQSSSRSDMDTLAFLLAAQLRPSVDGSLNYDEFVRGVLRRVSHGAVGCAGSAVVGARGDRQCSLPSVSPWVRKVARDIRRHRYERLAAAQPPPAASVIDERICFSSDVKDGNAANVRDDVAQQLHSLGVDVLVPTGGLPIPNENLFLFGFPEDDDRSEEGEDVNGEHVSDTLGSSSTSHHSRSS